MRDRTTELLIILEGDKWCIPSLDLISQSTPATQSEFLVEGFDTSVTEEIIEFTQGIEEIICSLRRVIEDNDLIEELFREWLESV